MSKFDNVNNGKYYWPFIYKPEKTGFSTGGVVPGQYLYQQFLANHHPFFKDLSEKIMEKERKEIMDEKYCIFASGDFERMGKFIEEKVKKSREKNAIKNSVLFNTDYEKVEESLKKAFEDPEMIKRFRENISGIFAHRNTKTNMFGDFMWGIRKDMANEKEKREKKEDGPRLIFEYIKKKKRGVVGILIGYKPAENSDFYVGYSLCNPKDKFDLFTAFQLAFHSMFRVQTYKNTPQSIKGQKRSFICRCAAYFKTARGGFMYTTYKDKFWADFYYCIPAEVRKNLEANPLDYKHFVLTLKKKEEAVINVMYANRVDTENVFDEETYYLDRSKRDFMYKNIRFGGCTHEKPSGRSVKITWEFVD